MREWEDKNENLAQNSEQWGPEYRTSPVLFEWSKVIRSLNGPVRMPYDYQTKSSPVFRPPFKHRSNIGMMGWTQDHYLNTKHQNIRHVQVNYSDPHCSAIFQKIIAITLQTESWIYSRFRQNSPKTSAPRKWTRPETKHWSTNSFLKQKRLNIFN